MSETNKKGLFLSLFTVVYNLIEGSISVGVGNIFGSISLVGFGLDSFIESLSGMILVWRFTRSNKSADVHNDKTEQKAIRMISYTFFILAFYIVYESTYKLLSNKPPQESVFGIIIAMISIIVMTFLYRSKKTLGFDKHIRSLVADSKQTLACIWLSIIMLFGVGLNYFFNIWWSDAVAGLVIAGFLLKEGYKTYKEKDLCGC
jgi:divalent metal cation (Fe/Co/Zn/Cd) transporter